VVAADYKSARHDNQTDYFIGSSNASVFGFAATRIFASASSTCFVSVSSFSFASAGHPWLAAHDAVRYVCTDLLRLPRQDRLALVRYRALVERRQVHTLLQFLR
jgi:hypothetical protein